MSNFVESATTATMKAGCALGLGSCTYNFFAENSDFITGFSGTVAILMMTIPPIVRWWRNR
jgi:hypothetical protein